MAQNPVSGIVRCQVMCILNLVIDTLPSKRSTSQCTWRPWLWPEAVLSRALLCHLLVTPGAPHYSPVSDHVHPHYVGVQSRTYEFPHWVKPV